jgi:hypothetical protein
MVDRHELTVHDDPSARDAAPVDMEAPHRQAALGPADLRGHPDRHRMVGRFEDPDCTRDLAVADRAGRADVGKNHQRPQPEM